MTRTEPSMGNEWNVGKKDLLTILDSFVYDYMARARCGGLHLNYFIIAETAVPAIGTSPRILSVLQELGPPPYRAQCVVCLRMVGDKSRSFETMEIVLGGNRTGAAAIAMHCGCSGCGTIWNRCS